MNRFKAAFASVLISLGCSAKTGSEASADRPSPHAWVSEGAALVDVRTPREFKQGHLPGAVNIPISDLGSRVAEIGPARVVVYCASGIRSKKAARMLKAQGKDVLDIRSMRGWDG